MSQEKLLINLKTNDGYYIVDYSVNYVEKVGKKRMATIDVEYNGTFEDYLKTKGMEVYEGKRFMGIRNIK